MPHGMDWDPPLTHFVGSPTNLDGIDVYHDFDWQALVGHRRRQFINGQCLSRVARSHCPQGKVPALVLTTKDVQPHPQTTDSHFFFIVNMPQALAATGNAAESLYASYLESEITRFAHFEQLASNPEMIEAVLPVERVAEWLREDANRRAQLQEALGVQDAAPLENVDVGALVPALRALMVQSSFRLTHATTAGSRCCTSS